MNKVTNNCRGMNREFDLLSASLSGVKLEPSCEKG